jgi:tyrosyl-tRNA synthetase
VSFIEQLHWRGFVCQTTHEQLGGLLDKESLTLYCGFDPTADSLHIGSLLPIMGLAHFQRAGHRPIALVGGGTGLIGDPSGKTAERQLLTKDDVARNAAGIRAQLEHFLDFSGAQAARMENNADWLCGLSLVDFLRDVGKHFSVNVMLAKESVRARLEDREHGISYTEFSYSLLQAYDYLHLHRACGCRLQVGGSDQWGNIVAGIDLIRRLDGAEAYGLTFPLVTKADGSKFGKSESGNVWLDPARTSPYRFYQFWINQADADVIKYLKYFTFLAPDEIAELEAQVRHTPEARTAQRRLAEEVTRLVHGETALGNAQKATQALFGGELRGLDEATLLEVFHEAPSSDVNASAFEQGRNLIDVLVAAGVFPSKGEAKRMVQQGGLYFNGERVAGESAVLSPESRLTPRIAVVRKGKKNYHLLRIV